MADIDPYGLKNPPLGVKTFQQEDDETDKAFDARLTEWLVKNKGKLRIYSRDTWTVKDKYWRIILWYYRDT